VKYCVPTMRTLGGIFLLLVACTDPPEPNAETVFGPALPDREQQGSTILGGLDSLVTTGDLFHVGSKATLSAAQGNLEVDVGLVEGQLRIRIGNTTHTGLSEVFRDMVFTGSDGKPLRIVGMAPASGDHPIRYFLLHGEGTGIDDPCDGEGAVPQPGRYTIDAKHVVDAEAITFSCEKGEVYKCNRFGYGIDDASDTVEHQYHQTCIYVTGARYCADRRSFTREGTEIAFFDRDGVRAIFPPQRPLLQPPQPAETWSRWILNTWPPPYDEFYVEAAWRHNKPPVCLAKDRWASLPRDPCDGALPDPRVDATAQYCESIIHGDTNVLDPDIIIVNTSRFNDIAIDIWGNVNGELLSTTRGQVDEHASFTQPQVVPPFNSNMPFVGHSGVLLRVPTQDMIDRGIAMQLLQVHCIPYTTRCVVTIPSPPFVPPLYVPRAVGANEGYVFVTKQPGTALLKLWHNPTTQDWVSAITRPTPGHNRQSDLGWIYTGAN
jgi:hypothetical protein